MPRITNVGEDYSGHREPDDPTAGLVNIPAGGEAEVGEAKASQLLRDFPEAFMLAADPSDPPDDDPGAGDAAAGDPPAQSRGGRRGRRGAG